MVEATAALVRVSAALAAGGREALVASLRHAADTAEPLAVEEALLQSYLFLGYPAALRGLAEWRRIGGSAAVAARAEAGPGEWAVRGAATCERVYGGQYERLRANVSALHPEMEQWMVAEGYGKVLSRPGLPLAVRELCIIALLAPQDAAPQLYSHLRGALNAGATTGDVEETVALLRPLLDAARRQQLEDQWRAVRERRAAESAGD